MSTNVNILYREHTIDDGPLDIVDRTASDAGKGFGIVGAKPTK